jgi:hypothetical protein
MVAKKNAKQNIIKKIKQVIEQINDKNIINENIYIKVPRSFNDNLKLWNKNIINSLKQLTSKNFIITLNAPADILCNMLGNNFVRNLGTKIKISNFLTKKHYYPETYIYNGDNNYDFLDNIEDNLNELWFLKPSINGCGIGIIIVNNKNDIIKNLQDSKKKYVIQRGINSLLIDNKKFDIRIHYIITYYKSQISFYLYNEGHIRLPKNIYDINDLNIETHITTYTTLLDDHDLAYLTNRVFDKNHNLYDILFPKIIDIMKDLSKEIKKSLINYKSNKIEYQICGPDIMFDNDLNPYILEVNSRNPGYIRDEHLTEMNLVKKNIVHCLANDFLYPAIEKNENCDFILSNENFIRLL